MPTRILSVSAILLALGGATLHAQGAGSSLAAMRADLAQFRTEFMAVDRSYSADARVRAESRLAALEANLEKTTPAAFEFEIARIVALADNGHTNVFASSRAARFNRVPLRLVAFGDQYYVLRARSPYTDLLGARLVSIDHTPVDELRTVARTLVGGTPAFRDRSAPFLLESPQQLQVLGVIASGDAATYRFEVLDGRTIERRLVPDAPDATRMGANPTRWMYPEPNVNDGEGWQSLLGADKAPWALKEAGVPFRWRDAPEVQGLVVEFRQNFSSPPTQIQAFMSTVEAEIRQRQPRNLVLDMRMNGGGNLQLTRDFAKRLPTLVPGRVFVLTSPWTFSAAISTVGYLKQAAPERVTIVGEMLGDRLEFWAEGGPVRLQNSGIQIGRALQRHDYAGGCRAFTDCHGAVVSNPIAVPSLAPGIEAPWTIRAYVAGKDPGMDAIAAALRRPVS